MRVSNSRQYQPGIVMTWLLSALFLFAVCIQTVKCHQAAGEYSPYRYSPYSFGYDVEDNYGNKQWRQEKSHDPMEVHGSYGYRDNNGVYREVVYVADKNGFKATIKTNELGVSGAKNPASVKIESYPTPTSHQSYSPQSSYQPPTSSYARYTPSGTSYYHSQIPSTH